MSTTKKLYTGEKKKGLFHHSSFLAGGATLAVGRLVASDGVLKIRKANDDYEASENGSGSFSKDVSMLKIPSISDSLSSDLLTEENDPSSKKDEPSSQPETKNEYKRTLSGGLQSPRADVSKTAILQRMNSKKTVKSYQLGNQLSVKWSTSAGPRIGCIADYPMELRWQVLELTNLSPRTLPPLSTPRRIVALVSHSARSTLDV